MITSKKVNLGISIISQLLCIVIVLYFSMLLAHGVWWLLSSSQSDLYVEGVDLDQSDTVTGYIINRYPLGVVTAPKEPPKPKIAEQIKLNGVYLSDKDNSYAFIEYNKKFQVIKQGQTINGQAAVKLIKPNGIVIVEDGVEASINLSSGDATINNMDSSYGNPQIFDNSQYSGSSNDYRQSQQYDNPPPNNQAANDEFREKRDRMIQEMMQREREAAASPSYPQDYQQK